MTLYLCVTPWRSLQELNYLDINWTFIPRKILGMKSVCLSSKYLKVTKIWKFLVSNQQQTKKAPNDKITHTQHLLPVFTLTYNNKKNCKLITFYICQMNNLKSTSVISSSVMKQRSMISLQCLISLPWWLVVRWPGTCLHCGRWWTLVQWL